MERQTDNLAQQTDSFIMSTDFPRIKTDHDKVGTIPFIKSQIGQKYFVMVLEI